MSEQSYKFIPNRKKPSDFSKDKVIPAEPTGILMRDDELYKNKFMNFNEHFYRKIYKGQEYPIDFDKQGLLFFCNDDNIVFLGLNSCWNIDHHYTRRAGINPLALNNALDKIMDKEYDKWLKIAVWHHPVTGLEMMTDDFLELLSVHGFQVCMHGHIHETKESFYKHDSSKGIHIIGAGTFGAPYNEQVPGIPLQYNLIKLNKLKKIMTIETRKKEKPNGSWSGDARWFDKNNPKPRYHILFD